MLKVPLSNPDITSVEKKLVMDVLNTPNLSLGPKLPEFEQLVCEAFDAQFAIAVNSGTSGLHLCVKSTGLKTGDEVVTTPFSFVASANCLLYERCIPKFVDIDIDTYNIDVTKIEAAITPRTRAILPVHVFGRPCNMSRIMEIARQYNLIVIEDACEAVGAACSINDVTKSAGTIGNCGVFAFYPNKQLTTGEGGVIVTNNESIAMLCRSFRNQGRSNNGSWLMHERLGYNYRLSDINCALGIGQFQRMDEILAKRERVAAMYNERFASDERIHVMCPEAGTQMSWFVYVIRLADRFTESDRNTIIHKLLEHGIGCNRYFPPIHLQPFYQSMFGYRNGDFPVTEHVAGRTIALPFFSNLVESDIDFVVEKLTRILNELT